VVVHHLGTPFVFAVLIETSSSAISAFLRGISEDCGSHVTAALEAAGEPS